MNRGKLIRRALWTSVAFNVGAACLFAFPSSLLGRLAGLSGPVPPIYGALLARFVLLKYCRRLRLACSTAQHRLTAFAIIFFFWLLGEAPA